VVAELVIVPARLLDAEAALALFWAYTGKEGDPADAKRLFELFRT
jgi:hypothetical protein